jgi:hypothetical protein
MKNMLIIGFLVMSVSSLSAQKNFSDSISEARNRLTRHAMIGLGAWSVANIASGFIIANQTSGETKYFWRMNAYWNFINLGLAGVSLLGAHQAALHHYSFSENYSEQQKIEKLYVFNAGLDLFYIAGGFLLREHGNTEYAVDKQDQFRGYGSSIAVQGGFLLLMDALMYSLHHKNTMRMNRKLQRLELNAGPGWMSLNYKF